MKVNDRRKEIVITRLKHYAKLLKVKHIPDLVLEVIPMNSRTSNTKQWGHYYMPKCKIGGMIFINVKKHKSEMELSYTILHELVHVKHPNWEHGKKFESVVQQYLNT